MAEQNLNIIDPHVHMSARTTDDYEAMAAAGVVAVIEPAFWLGQPRTSVGSFIDYFNSLVGWERFRASQFGIQHYCSLGLNSKEANNESLAEAVMEILPRYLCKERVVAVGEIGFDEMTSLEERFFREQLVLAKSLDMMVVVHTPHRAKVEGTLRSMDICEDIGLDPSKVIMDHNNEQTVAAVLDRGYWAAFTLYPRTKMSHLRLVDIVKSYGAERIIADSSADWGVSDPLALPKASRLMLEQGVERERVEAVFYGNALEAYGQSGQILAQDWEQPAASIDQKQLFEGNSVLRGQEPKFGSFSDS